MAKRRKKRPVPCPPAPANSARMYVQIQPRDIARFRFFLEAHDNLGIFTVADKFKGILMLRYSPHQQREFDEFLEGMKEEMELTIITDGPLITLEPHKVDESETI